MTARKDIIAMMRKAGATEVVPDEFVLTMVDGERFHALALAAHEREKAGAVCTRSHPHENMDAMCELRTEIARLTNENARLKAGAQALREAAEKDAKRWRLFRSKMSSNDTDWLESIRAASEQAWGDRQPTEAEIDAVMDAALHQEGDTP